MQIPENNNITIENSLDSLNYKYEVFRPKILVFGVGGGGVNAVSGMVENDLDSVDFVVANTDYQSLERSPIPKKILLGKKLTKGMGAGADPFVGKGAAEESIDEIEAVLKDISMVFITAGMGGGTGTGAAPVIAQKAKEMGILVVAIVTKPFFSDGTVKMQLAEQGIKELKKYVDTLIVLPNQNLFRLANQETRLLDSLQMVDGVLKSGVRGITDLITKSGFRNADFADVRTIMQQKGKAMMGTGEASGTNRALRAVDEAIANPLLDNISIKNAKGIIINITGSPDITILEHEEAVNKVIKEIDNEFAQIIIGSVFDENMGDSIRVSIFATGIDDSDDYNENTNTKKKDDEEEYVLNDKVEKNVNIARERKEEKLAIKKEMVTDSFGVHEFFFDIGEAASYDEFSKSSKISNKKNSLDDDGDDEKVLPQKEVDRGDEVAKSNVDNNKKRGFLSSIFGKKNSEVKINIEDADDDDFNFDIKLYNQN
jgi:cell division protein FtsZ